MQINYTTDAFASLLQLINFIETKKTAQQAQVYAGLAGMKRFYKKPFLMRGR